MEESKAEESRFNRSDRLRLKAHNVSENGTASFFRWKRKRENLLWWVPYKELGEQRASSESFRFTELR
jgi:hypothetical protein